MTEFIILSMLGILAQFLYFPIKAAKYAKYFIKARDYLNILFPVETYPPGIAFDNRADLQRITQTGGAVPIEAVKQATKDKGFNIPFLPGR